MRGSFTGRLERQLINDKKVLGVIPARGGSRRCPMKNVTLYKGKALLQWAMDHAAGSKYLDKWVVSTEDANIAKLAGAGNVLDRPACLATDRATTESVLAHALYSFPGYDYAVILQPTSPNRTVEDIDRCIEIAHANDGKNGMHGCVSYNPWGKRNGAVYVLPVPHFLETLSFDAANHYEMPVERCLDIDYPWDFNQ